jgi:cell division protein FtsB
LALIDCNLTSISRENLLGLANLKELYLTKNLIEKLPTGLFEPTPKLEVISFRFNKIKEIDADILKPLKDLKCFDLRDNISIDVEYDVINNEGNATLVQLKKAIKKCDQVHQQSATKKKEDGLVRNEIANLKIDSAKMMMEMDAVKQDNAVLKKDIGDLQKDNVELKKDNDDLKKEIADLKKKDDIGMKRKFEMLEENYDRLSAEFKKFKDIKQIICNFTVTINGKEFQVNKDILAANSPVLKRLMEENRDVDHVEVELEDISENAFEDILTFMYTKNPPNNATNLFELFAASGRLEMKELMDATADILKEKITLENALDVMNLCKKYPHDELRKKAFDELKKDFADN